VTFHETVPNPHPWWQFWAPDTKDTKSIAVDNRFPAYTNGRTAFEQPGDVLYDGPNHDGEEIWPMILEKAYAVDHNGYAAIANGGYMEGSFKEITGNDPTTVYPDTPQWTFDTLATAWQNGDAIGVNTLSGDAANNNPLYHGEHPLVAWHDYYVTNVDPTNKTITMRNPWGWGQGETTLTWDQFQSATACAVYVPLPNDHH
jgi:hypothetical protein